MHKKHRTIIAIAAMSVSGGFVAYRTIFAADSNNTITASGTVEATQAELGFQTAGRLQQISVREGDQVAAGAQIAMLERDELIAQKDVAKAQLAGAHASLAELTAGSRREEIAEARAALTIATERRDGARRDVERLRPLADQSLVSKQTFDRQSTDLSIADGQVAQANEQLQILQSGPRAERIAAQRAATEQAAAVVGRMDAMLAQTLLVAPVSGVVTVRHREPGEALSPGLPVVTLRDLQNRWVRIYVPGDQVGRITLGQAAVITADADPSHEYKGVVSYIASVAEFTPRNVQTTKDRVKLVYEVRVRITGDESIDLKPGLPADVRFNHPAAN
jgi:HlyD family secretion protein